MKRFAQEYPQYAILQQPVAKLEETPLAFISVAKRSILNRR